MRISSFLLVGLIVSVAVFLPDGSEAVTPEDPQDFDDLVIVESYKKVSSTHLVITPTTKSSYQNVVIYVVTSDPVRAEVNGSEVYSFTPFEAGSKLLLHFDEGEKVDLRIYLGTSYTDYSFTVRKTISIKELDPEEESEDPVFTVGDVYVFCIIAGVAGVGGVYFMYRFFKRRALMEVRSLGKD